MAARARTFAGWGWAAAVVDYRGFADAPGDVVRAYDAARRRFPGLPICAYGESAGGHLALMLAVRRPLACVVDAAGPVDLPRLGGTPQADWVRAKALAAFGDLRDASPTRHAAAIRAPVLAGYAAADRIVPASQGRYLKRALPRARVHRARPRRRPALRARQRAAGRPALVVERGARRASARRVAAQVVGVGHRPPARRLDLEQLERRRPSPTRARGRRGSCRRRSAQAGADVRVQRAHDARR